MLCGNAVGTFQLVSLHIPQSYRKRDLNPHASRHRNPNPQKKVTGRSDEKARMEAWRLGLISEYATNKWCEALAEGFARMELFAAPTDAEVFAHTLLTGKGGS